MDESEDPIAGGKKDLFYTKIKQTNKNYPVGEKKQTDWTGLDWTVPRYGNEPTPNCKHKEIIKGANEEGNEGEQLGKMNQ